MNLGPSGYEARELPDCSTLQRGVRPDRGSGEKNLIEPHNAPRKERAISKESRPRDRAACFVEIRRLQQPCARPTLSNEHHREMEWSGRSRDQQPTASVTAGCRSCNYLESKNPRRVAQRAREWMCPTSNFRSVSRNFCVVKSRRTESLTANANRGDCREVRGQKSLTTPGINHAGAARTPSGISGIDSRLIDTAELAVSPRSAFGEKRT